VYNIVANHVYPKMPKLEKSELKTEAKATKICKSGVYNGYG